MKTKLNTIALLFALLFAGCQAGPERVAYNSLHITSSAVDAAMSAAADAYVAGELTDEQWVDIAEAHDKYQPAFALAVELAAFDYNAFTPGDVARLARVVTETVTKYLNH